MIAHLLNRVCELSRPTRISDNQGGWFDAPSIIGRFPCRVMAASTSEIENARRAEAIITHAIYLMPETDVQIGDSIIVDGVTYRVTVEDIAPSVRIYRKILAKQMQTGEP